MSIEKDDSKDKACETAGNEGMTRPPAPPAGAELSPPANEPEHDPIIGMNLTVNQATECSTVEVVHQSGWRDHFDLPIPPESSGMGDEAVSRNLRRIQHQYRLELWVTPQEAVVLKALHKKLEEIETPKDQAQLPWALATAERFLGLTMADVKAILDSDLTPRVEVAALKAREKVIKHRGHAPEVGPLKPDNGFERFTWLFSNIVQPPIEKNATNKQGPVGAVSTMMNKFFSKIRPAANDVKPPRKTGSE
jgi:hypothetical protein